MEEEAVEDVTSDDEEQDFDGDEIEREVGETFVAEAFEDEQQSRCQDEAHDDGFEAFEETLNVFVLEEVLQDRSDEQDDDETWENHAKRRDEGAWDARLSGADISRHVDGDRARGAFRDADEVIEAFFAQPVMPEDRVLEQGNHRVAPTKGEETDFEEFPEELPVDHFFSSGAVSFFFLRASIIE